MENTIIIELAKDYFRAWNEKDIVSLKGMFDKNIILTDWEINLEGSEAVITQNKIIFKKIPSIKATIISLAANYDKVMVQLDISLNFAEVLKVVDIIEFTKNNKIKSITAFKC